MAECILGGVGEPNIVYGNVVNGANALGGIPKFLNISPQYAETSSSYKSISIVNPASGYSTTVAMNGNMTVTITNTGFTVSGGSPSSATYFAIL